MLRLGIQRSLAHDLMPVVSQAHGHIANRLTGIEPDFACEIGVGEIEHDRAFSGAELGETLIELVLETRGPDHVEQVAERLGGLGYRIERR